MAATVISGASRGLGMTLLDCLLERGHTVLGLARSFPDRLEQLAAAQPARLRLRACDLRAPEDVPTASELADFLDSADDLTLINNAATVDPLGAVGSLPAAQLLAAITVNLIGPMLLTNAFLAAIRDPALNPAEQGVVLRQSIERVRIIFITSSVATRPKPGNSAYGASKAGGEAFFATLRAEQQHDPRLLVEVIDPGAWTQTCTRQFATVKGSTFLTAGAFAMSRLPVACPSPRSSLNASSTMSCWHSEPIARGLQGTIRSSPGDGMCTRWRRAQRE